MPEQPAAIKNVNTTLLSSNGNPLIARLIMLTGDQARREYQLVKRVTTMGRSANNDIVISDPKTSRHHLEIVLENDGHYYAVDTGSANGFLVDDKQAPRTLLRHGAVITIGLIKIAFQIEGVPLNAPLDTTAAVPITQPPTVKPDESSLEHIDLRGRPLTLIGREKADNQIVLDNPQVSRVHLQIINQSGTFSLNDLRSTNGTFVNGQRITTLPLNDGDIINIGPYRFMFANGFLNRSQDDESVRVDVLNLTKQVAPNVNLLQNVSFTILPREFVAIVGGSGTGKSTLMDAISGVRPATGGAILYNKAEYYSQMEVYRSSIGYVPQDDIVAAELTVYKALYYAARLRLPQDTSEAEMKERIDDVIDDLDLELRANTPIHLLSGGQRKRVSIGAELISKPSLFFLDEPTSGLDPGLEGRMMELLRKLADQGRTVVLITHATQNVELCDQVLFMARGGYIAFYGSPQNALQYFGVTRFAEIYNKLEHEATPEDWAQRFLGSPYYARNIKGRLQAVSEEAARYGVQINNNVPIQAPKVDTPPVVFRRAKATLSGIRQFELFTRRYFEILTSDKKNLLILFLQAPIIALMMVLVFSRRDFIRPGGDYTSAKTLVFLMVIVAVWLGTSNAAREIVKEASIYKRERRIGLKLIPYIFSKLVVQSLLVMVQVALLVAIVWAGTGLGTASVELVFYLYFTLVLTALAGVSMGLLISAMTNNSDRATSFVPVVLIPQIIFSGAVVALERMGILGEWFSNLMVGKWGYQATGRILSLDTIPSTPIRFSGPPPDQARGIEALFQGSVFFDPNTLDWYLIPKRAFEFTQDVFLQWGIIMVIIVFCLALIVTFQLRKDRNYNR